MIELCGVSRVYPGGGSPVRALDGIDLELPAGEYVSVMGPSGSGKSTLLNRRYEPDNRVHSSLGIGPIGTGPDQAESLA